MIATNTSQLEDIGGAWAEASRREGVANAGHGQAGEVNLTKFNFMGAYPNNPSLFIGATEKNISALAAHPGLVVIVQSGRQFYPAVTTVTVHSDGVQKLGFTRLPESIDPAGLELTGGALAELKKLQAQQDMRTGSEAYDRRTDQVKDVAGHGGALLLRVRDQLGGRQSGWTAHDSHTLARDSGGFGVGIAAAGLYRQRMDGREVMLPQPVYGGSKEHAFFIYSAELDRAVSDALSGLSPEATATASGILAVGSLTEQPAGKIVSTLVAGL